MSRTIDDIAIGDFSFPDAGKHACVCKKVEGVKSSNGNTGIKLTWLTHNGEHQFSDTLWLTAKAIGRLALIAKKLIPKSKDMIIDDDDSIAVFQLGECIENNIENVYAIIEIVEYDETFIHESGDKIGQKETRKKKRVAFSGYEADVAADVF